MPAFQDPRRWANSPGAINSPLSPAFPPTATAPPQYPGLHLAIAGLLTPGLVPDIARQSAEVSAGGSLPVSSAPLISLNV